MKFFVRWWEESSLDEAEKGKAEHEQSGLLGATKRITKRTRKLAIYSGIDLLAGGLKLFAEIFSASGPAAAGLAAASLVIGTCKTIYSTIETFYAAAKQQEAKLGYELNEQGAGEKLLKESDDLAVTAIIVEAKEALDKGDNEHIAVKKLAAFDISVESAVRYSVKELRAAIMKEIDREEEAKTLWQKLQFWK